jgi:uroporphyrinogen-III decarboxylase
MISIKDNFMRVMRGEMPEYVPRYRMWGVRPAPLAAGKPGPDGKYKDVFGVEYTMVPGTGPIQTPNKYLFEDITKWRDYVKLPDLSGIDWAAEGKKAKDGWNPELPMGSGYTQGFFQIFYSMMGFENALIACAEEPEEIKAALDYITDFYVKVAKEIVAHYKPDFGTIGDDIAHYRGTFVSLEMYRELFRPYWQRYINVFKEADIPVLLHDCGHNMILVDDFVEIGINAWEPAEEVNDLLAIKKKYGRKLALFGGFRQNGIVSYPDTTEEQIRAEVRKSVDQYAPGGGYGLCGIVLGAADDPEVTKRNAWIADEYQKIADDKDWYKNHPPSY